MPQNDPAVDSLNYGGMSGVRGADFDAVTFDDVEEGDLFWLTDSSNSHENHALRKVSETTAFDTRTQVLIENLKRNQSIYQKT